VSKQLLCVCEVLAVTQGQIAYLVHHIAVMCGGVSFSVPWRVAVTQTTAAITSAGDMRQNITTCMNISVGHAVANVGNCAEPQSVAHRAIAHTFLHFFCSVGGPAKAPKAPPHLFDINFSHQLRHVSEGGDVLHL